MTFLLDSYIDSLSSLPESAFDDMIRSTVMVTIVLEDIYEDLEADPEPALDDCLRRQLTVLDDVRRLAVHRAPRQVGSASVDTAELFESAWTAFSPATYDHSVSLVEARLRASGINETYLAGKRCFDGGCGIGRLSVALARMGAGEVVAGDIGAASLSYLKDTCARLGISTITPVEQDVTNLSNWADGTFDFVASYGVLHHTPDCLGGLREHFRVLKPGGELWLYLYGDGGMYWPVYDRLRDVVGRYPLAAVKKALAGLNLREGLYYTYLDNVLAPRTYHLESDIVALLREIDPSLTWRRAQGTSPVDDNDLCLATGYGAAVVGPEGEVRIIVRKSI